jgi:beta-glucosidase
MNWKGVIHDARTAKYVDVIKKPRISIKNGTVTITCTTPGVKIYYTTDNATPAFIEANLYSKPFKLSNGVTVKAIAKKYGFDNSGLVESWNK